MLKTQASRASGHELEGKTDSGASRFDFHSPLPPGSPVQSVLPCPDPVRVFSGDSPQPISDIVVELLHFLKTAVRSQNSLVAENLFLRKQLAFYRERRVKPRRLTDAARVALVFWSRWFDWRHGLSIVQPETLIRWHRQGFKLFCRWKSKAGRPRVPQNIRDLIARMAKEESHLGPRPRGV